MKRQNKPSEFTLSTTEINIIKISTRSMRDRTLIESLYYAGLRREEAVNLEIKDIDFQRRRITILGKFNKQRVIPIIDINFIGNLKHLIGDNKKGYVFTKSDGNKLTTRMVNKIVQKAGERANLKNPNPNMKNINPHLFRHSVARHLKSKGFSTEWIQNFLGHESFKTTMDTYGTLSLEEMQQISDKKLGLIEDRLE